jgi:hypothetical protein
MDEQSLTQGMHNALGPKSEIQWNGGRYDDNQKNAVMMIAIQGHG